MFTTEYTINHKRKSITVTDVRTDRGKYKPYQHFSTKNNLINPFFLNPQKKLYLNIFGEKIIDLKIGPNTQNVEGLRRKLK